MDNRRAVGSTPKKLAGAVAASLTLTLLGLVLVGAGFWFFTVIIAPPGPFTHLAPIAAALVRNGIWLAALSVWAISFLAFFTASRRFPSILGLWACIAGLPVAIGTQQLARSIAAPLQVYPPFSQGGYEEQLLVLVACGSGTYAVCVAAAVVGALSGTRHHKDPSQDIKPPG